MKTAANDEGRTGLGGKLIAVTGGAGFIGSHLCATLWSRGHHVVCLDNFLTGSEENVSALMDQSGFSLIEHDVVSPFPAELPRFDEIYNFACPASPVHYQADRVRTARTCAEGTMQVLERARRDGARVFQASTSEVYGDPEVHPQVEGYFGNVNPVGPRSCYDEGKRFAETLVTDYAAQYGLVAKIVRIFNTYGPHMQPDDGRVVSNFIVQALRGEDITIYGAGDQTRSFCFVSDLVDGCIRLMESDERVNAPVNIGNPIEVTVSELADIIIDMVGSRSKVVYLPLPVDDPRRRRPDISRARHHLGWSPRVHLADGLRSTIDYFQDRLRSEESVLGYGGALAARV